MAIPNKQEIQKRFALKKKNNKEYSYTSIKRMHGEREIMAGKRYRKRRDNRMREVILEKVGVIIGMTEERGAYVEIAKRNRYHIHRLALIKSNAWKESKDWQARRLEGAGRTCR